MNIAFLSDVTAVRGARGAMSSSFSFLVLRFFGAGFFSGGSSSASSWLSHSCLSSSSSLSSTALRFLVGTAFLLLAAGAEGSALVLVLVLVSVTAFLPLAIAVLTFSAAFSSTLTAAAVALLRGDVRGGMLNLEKGHRNAIDKLKNQFGAEKSVKM